MYQNGVLPDISLWDPAIACREFTAINGIFYLDFVSRLSYICSMIIFDASTLILLIKIDLLELFISDFNGRIAIPRKVKNEVCVEGKEETPQLQNLIKEGTIEVQTAKSPKQKRKLMFDFNIDEGEAEALLLALQKEAELIATDDRNAIRASKLLKIDFVTAIGFLIRAAEKKLINEDEALFKLEKLRSISRYSLPIIENAKNRIKGDY